MTGRERARWGGTNAVRATRADFEIAPWHQNQDEPDPGRTPGQAEGVDDEREQSDEGVGKQPDPGKTPGQAEGTNEDVGEAQPGS